MTRARTEKLLRLSCWMTLLGLVMFVWSVVDPRPVPVMIAMSIGQGIGMMALRAVPALIADDFRRR